MYMYIYTSYKHTHVHIYLYHSLIFSALCCRSIERSAQHEAKRTEQKAKGQLERQKLQNEKVCMCVGTDLEADDVLSVSVSVWAALSVD